MSVTLALVLIACLLLIVAMVGMALRVRRMPRASESHVVLDQLAQHQQRMEDLSRDLQSELTMWRDLEGSVRRRILQADADGQLYGRRAGDALDRPDRQDQTRGGLQGC